MSEELPQAGDATEVENTVDQELSVEDLKAALARANREAAGRRVSNKEKEAELAEYREWKKSQMSEVDRLKSENAEIEARLRQAQKENLQRKIAEKAGLDSKLATRLVGDSEEEMLADARALAAELPGGKSTASGMLAGTRGRPVGQSAEESDAEWFRKQFSN